MRFHRYSKKTYASSSSSKSYTFVIHEYFELVTGPLVMPYTLGCVPRRRRAPPQIGQHTLV